MYRLTAIHSASQSHAIQTAGADTFSSEAHHENVAGCSLNKINNSLIVFMLRQTVLWITMLQCWQKGTRNTRDLNTRRWHQPLELDIRDIAVHYLPTVVILKWPSWDGVGWGEGLLQVVTTKPSWNRNTDSYIDSFCKTRYTNPSAWSDGHCPHAARSHSFFYISTS